MAKELVFSIKINGVDTQIKNISTLEKTVSELKKELKTTDIGSNQFKALSKSVTDSENQLKNLKKTIKETGQEVKGLQIKGDILDVGNAPKNYKELRDYVAALRKELDTTDLGSERWEKLNGAIQKASFEVREIKKDFKEMNAAAHIIGDVAGGAAGLAQGFSIATSAMALFGDVQDENVQKTLLQVQSSLALAQGLGSLPKVLADVRKGFDALKSVITANPYIAVAAAIALIAVAVYKYSQAQNGLSKVEKAIYEQEKQLDEIRKKSLVGMDLEITKANNLFNALKETNSGSKERKNLIVEINATYGTTLNNLDLEKDGLDKINIAQMNVINGIKSRIQAKISEQELEALITKEQELSDKYQTARNNKKIIDAAYVNDKSIDLQNQKLAADKKFNEALLLYTNNQEKQQLIYSQIAEQAAKDGIKAKELEAQRQKDLLKERQKDAKTEIEIQQKKYEELIHIEEESFKTKQDNLEIYFSKERTAIQEQLNKKIITEEEANLKLQNLEASQFDATLESVLSNEVEVNKVRDEFNKSILANTILTQKEKDELTKKANEDALTKLEEFEKQKQSIIENSSKNEEDIAKARLAVEAKAAETKKNAELDIIERRNLSNKQEIINQFARGEIKGKEDLNIKLKELELSHQYDLANLLLDGSKEKLAKIAELNLQEIELNKEKNDLIKKQEQEKFKELATGFSTYGGLASRAVADIQALFNQITTNQETELEKQTDATTENYDLQIEAAKKAGKNTDKLEQDKLKALYEIDKKKYQIEKEAFERNKAFQIVSAIINTAAGVTQALASSPPPVSFILAGITGALGAIEIATIASQEFNGKAPSNAGFNVPSIPSAAGGNPNNSGGQYGTGAEQEQTFGEGNDTPSNYNIKVMVLESDITNTQNAVASIEQISVF